MRLLTTFTCISASTSINFENCSAYASDDPYLRIVLGYAHEQKAHGLYWVESIGVAYKNVAFAMLVGLAKRFKAQ
jgi:hypothetical protein